MFHSEKVSKQVAQPEPRLLNVYRRSLVWWRVWGLESELKQLERSRHLVPQEGADIIAGALIKELGALKAQLGVGDRCAAESKRAAAYRVGERLEEVCACRL